MPYLSDQKNITYPILLDIVNKLRSIEHQIFIGTRKIHADYDDYQKVKMIIEAITI